MLHLLSRIRRTGMVMLVTSLLVSSGAYATGDQWLLCGECQSDEDFSAAALQKRAENPGVHRYYVGNQANGKVLIITIDDSDATSRKVVGVERASAEIEIQFIDAARAFDIDVDESSSK